MHFIHSGLMYRIYKEVKIKARHFQTMVVRTLALNNKALKSHTAVCKGVKLRQCFRYTLRCVCRPVSVTSPLDQSQKSQTESLDEKLDFSF